MTDQTPPGSGKPISFSATKSGLRQRANGDWTLHLIVALADMPQAIINAAAGTAFKCSFKAIEAPDDAAVEHAAWRDLGPTTQAGIRCKEPVFWAFLREGRYQLRTVTDEETAVWAVHEFCHVASRADLGKPGNQRQRVLWHQLDEEYQGWRLHEHA